MAGFLLTAVDILDTTEAEGDLTNTPALLGSWYIPAHNTFSQYLHCRGGLQTAVTHTSNCSMQHLVTLQWKPPAEYQGGVRI